MMENLPVHGQQSSERFNAYENGLAFCTAETEIQSQRLDTLFQRINAASGLV